MKLTKSVIARPDSHQGEAISVFKALKYGIASSLLHIPRNDTYPPWWEDEISVV